MSPEEMCRAALNGFEVEILDQAPVHYVCNCSKGGLPGAYSLWAARSF